ncbi:Zinc-specific metallo-regulatory protein [Anatilimnocola aggregata]|uniref:Zinc-specific metallo-regulatory protein n=1 Tax=Anatilimnocola aggregata TaxID=2528021 RepID=A0A517Y9X8_9BACT|nr:Fur family transcriptional regulator [Anatilimnocola aggregata]QDU27043.1 Zinc-specific metallo-regulatory protein [Anatilimnocola aggregata]
MSLEIRRQQSRFSRASLTGWTAVVSGTLTRDFCPAANRHVYWLKHPWVVLGVAAFVSAVIGWSGLRQGYVVCAAVLAVLTLGTLWPWIGMLGKDSRSRWRALLRERGLKCTEQRLAVLQKLETATAPLSHRDLLDRLDWYQWDSTTVFRNLVILSEAGIVSRLDLGDHTWRFELRVAIERETPRHAHFLCTSCGSIECLANFPVAEAANKLHIAVGRRSVDDVLVKGRCPNCVQN